MKTSSAIHKRPSFPSGILRARNKRSSIAHLHMTIRQSVHGGHSCVSKTETGNRLWVSIILQPDMEASRGGCHIRKSGLKFWRQLSRRADPASSAAANPACSSTIMEFCVVLLLTSSSNFSFLGVLAPAGIESDKSDRRGHST